MNETINEKMNEDDGMDIEEINTKEDLKDAIEDLTDAVENMEETEVVVDELNEAHEKIAYLEAKVMKLKRLMLLVDENVKQIRGGVIQDIQWSEYVKAFPDEAI